MGGGRPAWAAPRRLGHARRPPGPTGGSGGSSFEINPVVCPVRRPASAHGTLRWCSWRAAVRAYPPPLAQPQPAQPCEPQGWCRVESFSLHLRRGVNDEIFLLRSTFPHQRCYISTTREPSVPVVCGCIPCAPQARPPAPCSVRLLTCRIHCAKSRPLGETITDPVSQPHYASCLAGPSERITKA